MTNAGLQEHFPSLGFIGAGNMAGAILRAVAGKRLISAERIMAIDAVPGKAEELVGELGIRVAQNLEQLMRECSSILLATKPQDLGKVLEAMRPSVNQGHRIISIAAGTRCAKIEAALPGGTRVVRVMPNTPAMIGEGAAGVAPGAHATQEDVEATRALFEAVGIAFIVDERHLDAITALSGSGPAYVFFFIEQMTAAGIEMGLDPELSLKLTIKTFLGASRLASESPEPPAELRRRVTSPGGTTAAALEVFERREIADGIREGLRRACERSIELASK